MKVGNSGKHKHLFDDQVPNIESKTEYLLMTIITDI